MGCGSVNGLPLDHTLDATGFSVKNECTGYVCASKVHSKQYGNRLLRNFWLTRASQPARCGISMLRICLNCRDMIDRYTEFDMCKPCGSESTAERLRVCESIA